jgi:Xaa-Pro aminopeptidase
VLEQANRAINLAPDDPYVYYPKANFLALSGRPSEAVGAADAVLAVNPNDVLLYLPLRASHETEKRSGFR